MAARSLCASVTHHVPYHPQLNARPPMAERSLIIAFKDVPLDEACYMSCGPRMDLELIHTIEKKIESLDNTATRLTIPEDTSTITMKKRILRVAAALGMPVTVR